MREKRDMDERDICGFLWRSSVLLKCDCPQFRGDIILHSPFEFTNFPNDPPTMNIQKKQ